ncbi:MAG: DUF924 family protein [Granulosicoccaceae bacterium]
MSDGKPQDKLHDKMPDVLHSKWQYDVLSFWFEELTPKQWYQSTNAVDDTIRNQFERLIALIASSSSDFLGLDARKLLAAIIVLDQFPRNIYRGSPAAFEYDQIALDLAEYAVTHGFDSRMSQSERQFCYTPFMHSENIETQNQSLELFNSLGNKGAISAAIEHRDIIEQFGRFPHRNKVLNRQSTQEEIQYLTHAKRFGQ